MKSREACDVKKMCCKMQKAGLESAMNALRLTCSKQETLSVLREIKSLLELYPCLPAGCLIDRINWLSKNLKDGRRGWEQRRVIIAELKEFLDNI